MKALRFVSIAWLVIALGAAEAAAGTAALDADAAAALKQLYAKNSAARTAGSKATAILVFPNIVKAGFMVGAQYGEGALMTPKGKVLAHYSSMAGSYGFQAGAQAFAYALFFMNKGSLSYLNKSEGWEIGVGPSIVLVDEGIAKSMTSTTLTQDVYAFIFSQEGLMAGAGIQGSKITKLK